MYYLMSIVIPTRPHLVNTPWGLKSAEHVILKGIEVPPQVLGSYL